MSRKVIAVNGQHLTINYSGGAGRYAQQIYKKLVDPEISKLDEFEIYPLNFSVAEEGDKAREDLGKKLVTFFKHSLFQCSPPIIFNVLQRAYNFANGHIFRFAQNSDINKARSVSSIIDLASTRLIHELTNYMSHGAIGRLSLSPKLALAVTFLDIQDFFYPEYFEDSVLKSRRMMYSFYKDRADVFFAISEFTKQTMVERLDISSSKIIVTPLAADDLLILKPSKETNDWVESFERFWIYPAKLWKHKNHAFLLKSLAKRKSQLIRAGIKLLLTGGFSKADTLFLNSMIKSQGLDDTVIILGFVSDEQLQALLKRAEFLVFPSLFEGFGMPILEAMTLGCPVISSNAGSLPEVAGDAAVFFNPTSEDEFVDLIDCILSGAGIERKLMIQKGFENCKRFSWDKTYSQTITVYKELLQ